MQTFTTSLTLGKASTGNANIAHNTREIIAKNVDVNRICLNKTYVNQDVEDAYRELFSESVAEYNSKQKQPCRRITDYYSHIENGKREEPFYELIVQFGDCKTAGIGTDGGGSAMKMLHEYMLGFQARNKNLHVFSAHLHLDEASPHIHIDFIPYYTRGRKNGLSKGVSMKAALIEMGFNPKGQNQNQLVLWQDSERKVMEQILRRHGFEREVKNDKTEHQSVPEFKKSQDAKRLIAFARSRGAVDPTIENVAKLQQENDLLYVEREKLLSEKSSPWKSFFYSDESQQSFVTAELIRLSIPFRETENGFEARECHVEQIRKIEKQYKPKPTSYRDELREILDLVIMQSKNFDEVIQRLCDSGCDVNRGKYLAVRPQYATNYIRTHKLGADYSEQAIRNRLVYKAKFENDTDNKIQSAVQDTLTFWAQKTIRHYTVVFASGVLPVRKRNKNKPFCWENDEQLDKLAELNKKINAGISETSLRNDFTRLEKAIGEKENKITELKSELEFFRNLYNKGERCFKHGSIDEDDFEFLAKHKVTAENYHRISQLFTDNENEIAGHEAALLTLKSELRDTADTLNTLVKVMGRTFVQSLVTEEQNRQQAAKFIHNGTKFADDSKANAEIEKVARQVLIRRK